MALEPNEYQRFTKPAELHKAINTLRGLVAGIGTDFAVEQPEIEELAHWCSLHAHLRDRHPFSEIIPLLEVICEDGIITKEEGKDILWVCSSFADNGNYYDEITASIQLLEGMIHGMMADSTLSPTEIKGLKSWIDANDFLAGTYPFDEINALLYEVLEDGKVTKKEREMLLAFFSNLIEFKNSLNLVEQDYVDLREKYSISAVCTLDPDVKIEGHTFCFTGASYHGTRDELAETVKKLGGIFRGSVSAKTDYLVIGDGGSAAWAYSCYGRKIESAINNRKQGKSTLIIREEDFWAAVDKLIGGEEDIQWQTDS